MIIKTKPCPRCRKVSTVDVTRDEITAYNKGALIQEAFPNLTNEQREQLMTGYDDTCWNLDFPPED